jgi:hypothetical protein
VNKSYRHDDLPIEGYTYDAVHNRMISSHQLGAWNYNQNHQLLSYGTEESKTVAQARRCHSADGWRG